MGGIASPAPVLLVLAAFSRHEKARAWARARAEEQWGEIFLTSADFDFSHTDYYLSTMGLGLRKTFWAFARPIDPGILSQVKRLTNAWEEEYAALGWHAEARPLNLDPGYLTLAKLVLASTKNYAHRIYLGGGIFAEITLSWRRGRWQHHEWTFPDYRRPDYHAFFTQCREHLHRLAQERLSP